MRANLPSSSGPRQGRTTRSYISSPRRATSSRLYLGTVATELCPLRRDCTTELTCPVQWPGVRLMDHPPRLRVAAIEGDEQGETGGQGPGPAPPIQRSQVIEPQAGQVAPGLLPGTFRDFGCNREASERSGEASKLPRSTGSLPRTLLASASRGIASRALWIESRAPRNRSRTLF